MMKLVIYLSLIVLVLNHTAGCDAVRSSNRGNSKYGSGNQGLGKAKPYGGTSPGIPSQSTTRRGVGISAWGIVFLVVALVVAGMGFYYFSMCYPYFCHRQEKYHIMGTPTMA